MTVSDRTRTALAALLLSVGSVTSAQEFELVEATIDDVHTALRSGALTCEDLNSWRVAVVVPRARVGRGVPRAPVRPAVGAPVARR